MDNEPTNAPLSAEDDVFKSVAKSPLSPSEIDDLVLKNEKLAYWFAARWGNIPGVDADDVKSQAMHGLVKAANTYQPSRGPFAAWASQIMRNYLNHLSHHQKIKTHAEVTSLDAPVGSEEEDSTLGDKVGDPDADHGYADSAEKTQAAEIISQEIEKLPEPDRTMVKQWMSGRSYRDMQAEFKTSFATIGNRVKAALSTIKGNLAKAGILNIQDIWPESIESDNGKFVFECLCSQVAIARATNLLQDEATAAKLRQL